VQLVGEEGERIGLTVPRGGERGACRRPEVGVRESDFEQERAETFHFGHKRRNVGGRRHKVFACAVGRSAVTEANGIEVQSDRYSGIMRCHRRSPLFGDGVSGR
jgi:hypothetical protein